MEYKCYTVYVCECSKQHHISYTGTVCVCYMCHIVFKIGNTLSIVRYVHRYTLRTLCPSTGRHVPRRDAPRGAPHGAPQGATSHIHAFTDHIPLDCDQVLLL